jgi:Subtilase family
MAEVTLSLASLAGRSGRGVRIAVVDSGVHAAHPHVGGIAGGAAFDADGRHGGDAIDRLGHGTAVAAAILEKAPGAELLAVKVFDRSLATTGLALVEAIRWAAGAEAALINLSLGTANAAHEPALAAAVSEASAVGAIVVAAAPQDSVRWLPGALPGVIAVQVDWDCPRDACQLAVEPDGRVSLRASGFPRPIPGVPPNRNVHGPSFAVANATGLIALAIEGERVSSRAGLMDCLRRLA